MRKGFQIREARAVCIAKGYAVRGRIRLFAAVRGRSGPPTFHGVDCVSVCVMGAVAVAVRVAVAVTVAAEVAVAVAVALTVVFFFGQRWC